MLKLLWHSHNHKFAKAAFYRCNGASSCVVRRIVNSERQQIMASNLRMN